MNEELEAKANDALASVLDGVIEAKDFVISQVPDVIHQLLTWNFTASIIPFMITLILFIIESVCFIRALKHYNKTGWPENIYDTNFVKIGSIIIVVLFLLSCFILIPIMCLNTGWLQIWLAPKVWLIEYAANIIK
jgi:hypothetical protein